jgi:O-succinylbenzoate synthase
LAAANSRPFTVPGDTSETRLYFHEDIVDPAVVLDDRGFIAVPEGAGTGVRINEAALEKVMLGRERLR